MLVLRSCPQEPCIEKIATPFQGVGKSSFISETVLAMVAARLGQVFSFYQQGENSFFQNIVPKPDSEDKQSNASSLTELHLHTETHFHPNSPDYLLLYCLRSKPNVKTFYVGINQLLKNLDEQSKDLLFKPLYRTGVSYIFGNTKEEPGNGSLTSVLYGNVERPFIVYDQDLMVGITNEAQEALDNVHCIFKKNHQDIFLTAGDLLIIDNRRVVHGRSSFLANYDGKDRWLQRTKVLRNLDEAADGLSANQRLINSKILT